MSFLSRKPSTQPQLTIEDAQQLSKAIKAGDLKPCSHCLGIHARACPRVKRMMFVGEEIKEIEFWETWDTSNIIFPDQIEEVLLNAEENSTTS